jgi:hypothetical protein
MYESMVLRGFKNKIYYRGESDHEG